MKRNRLVVGVGMVAALLGSYANAQVNYIVRDLPGQPLDDNADVNLFSAVSLDPHGRALIGAFAFYAGGTRMLRTERCNAEATSCTVTVPRNKEGGANKVSHDGTWFAGTTIEDPFLLAGWVIRRRQGGPVEYLFHEGTDTVGVTGVNSSGVVVGLSENGRSAWIFDGERRELKGFDFSIYNVPYAINDAGLVVGEGEHEFERRAVAWSGGKISLLQTDIPPGRSYRSYATAVTPGGVAYGTTDFIPPNTFGPRAVRFENGHAVNIGGEFAGSKVWAVNSAGIAVGETSRGAALFDGSGLETVLEDRIGETDRQKYDLQFAVAINDRGQILVSAWDNTKNGQAVLRLDPDQALKTLSASRVFTKVPSVRP